MTKRYLMLGGLFAFLGVALGAFGAHGLEDMLDADRLDTYEVGVRYQMYHALALIGVGLTGLHLTVSKALLWAGRLIIAGMCIFSGSLYVLSITGVTWLGAITPIGGVLMLSGWISYITGVYRHFK